MTALEFVVVVVVSFVSGVLYARVGLPWLVDRWERIGWLVAVLVPATLGLAAAATFALAELP